MADLPDLPYAALSGSKSIAKLCDELTTSVLTTKSKMEEAARSGAVDLARAFVVLHGLEAQIKVLTKTMAAIFEDSKTNLVPSVFEDEGTPHIPVEGRWRVGTSIKLVASIVPVSKRQAWKWLEGEKLGDLISPTVNAQSLASAMKHMIEEENRDPPSDMIRIDYVYNSSVTKTKK